MDELDLGYLLAASGALVWTPRLLSQLLRALGSARAIVEYAKAPGQIPEGCEPIGVEALVRLTHIDDSAARSALADARKEDCCLVLRSDDRYPPRLLDLCDPPPVLYYRGRLESLGGRVVALVGSRAATPYGRSMAASLAGDFASFGATVISGLARGVDAAAHRGALRAQAPTAAVIGSGLQALYPPYHALLADDIVAKGGVIISEFPAEMTARPHHFPMRNRLVAALACATVVIEASTKSGALITAGLANELGRPVFALPGDVGRLTSEGTNSLIKDGVCLATSAADVAGVLGWGVALSRNDSPDGCHALLGALAPGGSDVDEISAKTGLGIATVAAQLTMFEVQGLVQRQAGGLYSAVKP